MSVLKMKLDGEKYEVDPDKLTLGEALIMKRQYGMQDFTEFNFFDPEQMVGLFVIAVKRAHPELSDQEILAKVEGIENGPIFNDINKQVEEARKKAADPQVAGASASVPAAGSRRATTRKKPGSRS
jgi:hypothetical protein